MDRRCTILGRAATRSIAANAAAEHHVEDQMSSHNHPQAQEQHTIPQQASMHNTTNLFELILETLTVIVWKTSITQPAPPVP